LLEIRYTLLTDGSSDRALIYILTWLLHEHIPRYGVQGAWADLRRVPNPPRSLTDKIRESLDLYPCDLLFIHRDAENHPWENRINEIKQAFNEAVNGSTAPPAICVVPVRMTEAWLLFDLNAIKKAAGNPQGNLPIDLPELDKLEQISNPKTILHNALCRASGLSGRRLNKFNPGKAVHHLPKFIDNFKPLRELSAFKRLENDLQEIIHSHQWG